MQNKSIGLVCVVVLLREFFFLIAFYMVHPYITTLRHFTLTIYVYIHVCLTCGSNVTYIGLERGPMAPEVSMATVVKR